MISTVFCPTCGAAHNEQTSPYCLVCGQFLADTVLDTRIPDEMLLQQHYKLGSVLGTGGFSIVYRAHDLQSGQDVAIKQITLHGRSTEEVIEATDTFNREVRLLSTLHHPQVPQLIDYFGDSDHWYLVMDYLEGPTLETYLETHTTLMIDEVLDVALQLCQVLEYLHTRQPPIIYRDLKPGNIIRSPEGKLSLIDYGIARYFRPGQKRDTLPLGSPGYAAPEQYGQAQTTPQSDIYSLGMLIDTLLSGQDPTEPSYKRTPVHPSQETGMDELDRLVQRMCSPQPAGRPATIHDVTISLKAIRQQRTSGKIARIWYPPTPHNLPTTTRIPRHIQLLRYATRRQVLAGLGVLIATGEIGTILWENAPHPAYVFQGPASVSGVAWSPHGRYIATMFQNGTLRIWSSDTGKSVCTYQTDFCKFGALPWSPAWSPDSMHIAVPCGRSIQVYEVPHSGHIVKYSFSDHFPQMVAWSPDGTRLAWISPLLGSGSGVVQVGDAFYSRNILTCPIPSPSQAFAIAWSPDSTRIASCNNDGSVQILDAATGSCHLVYQPPMNDDEVSAIAWSPDGIHIASSYDSGYVQLWNATNGSLVYQQSSISPIQVISLAWSPDGTRIVSSIDSDNSGVQVWNTTNGENIFTYRGHADLVTSVAWSPDGKRIASGSYDKTVQVWDAP